MSPVPISFLVLLVWILMRSRPSPAVAKTPGAGISRRTSRQLPIELRQQRDAAGETPLGSAAQQSEVVRRCRAVDGKGCDRRQPDEARRELRIADSVMGPGRLALQTECCAITQLQGLVATDADFAAQIGCVARGIGQ